jgi:hypothetical protein
MTTRVGKIAQLPKSIRDDLNQRLENGKQGPELLKWLNSLPETQELLAEKFDAMPINRQNLTEWRQGGYEDWLRHQQREQRIQRVIEEGADLEHIEGPSDLFENCARIAVAEWMADMDTLHELRGEERSKRLRALTFDLARLQNAWNRSSWAALAWSKWNERFLGPDDYKNDKDQEETKTQTPATPSNADLQSAVSPNCIRQAVATAEISTPAHATETQNTTKTPEIKPHQTASIGGESQFENSLDIECSQPREEELVYLRRPIYHHQPCGHVCRQCHPDTSDYPYAEALKDSTEAHAQGVQAFWRDKTMIITQPTECHCPCHECNPQLSISPIHSLPEVTIDTSDPCADFLRQAALRRSVTHPA